MIRLYSWLLFGALLAGLLVSSQNYSVYAQISRVSLNIPLAVEMFSGSGNLATSLEKLGWCVARHDILHGINILDPGYLFHIKVMISTKKRLRALTIAVCCTTFSRANTGHPYRSTQYPCGLPNLSDRHQRRCTEGNQLLHIAIEVALFARKYHCHVWIENPTSSILWLHPLVRPLVEQSKKARPDWFAAKLHYCMYGKPYKKPTMILSSSALTTKLRTRCIHKKHAVVLEGSTKKCGSKAVQHKTKWANPYPQRLCAKWGALIHRQCCPRSF